VSVDRPRGAKIRLDRASRHHTRPYSAASMHWMLCTTSLAHAAAGPSAAGKFLSNVIREADVDKDGRVR
jgi:hypothetical protein